MDFQHKFWALEVEEVFSALDSTPQGLSKVEAERRLARFGKNVIPKRRVSQLFLILGQFRSSLILILVAAGVLTVLLGEYVEAAVIFAAVFANAALGYLQERKAEAVLAALEAYVRTETRVRRDGTEEEIDASLLIPGDVIHLRQGDRVPADGRVTFSRDFEVDESVLTGESMAVKKDPAACPADTLLPDRASMVFSGTLVVEGLADVLVTAAGTRAEFGKIAALATGQSKTESPLQKSIGRFTGWIGLIVGVLSGVLFLLGLRVGYGVFDMFLIATAVAVSAVPEGLPIAVTVILAVGVERLARRRGLIRRLLAAETLGSTTVILTDKTGTLTEARMVATSIDPFQSDGSEKERELLEAAVLTTDAVVENPDEASDHWRVLGRPIEAALTREAAARGAFLPRIMQQNRILDRLPFNSDRKFSATLSISHNVQWVTLLGAPEAVLEYTGVSVDERLFALKEVEKRARRGERILGVAARRISDTEEHPLSRLLEQKGLEFLGTVSFRDPVRPDVAEAVRQISAAGVRTVIVTGDHQGTAEAVAREVGILDGGQVVSAKELSAMSDRELDVAIRGARVFARVTPEDKLHLVRRFQASGEIVAVTGDGVNDAPALKGADIGVAVGSGTEVAKQVSDLVLLDNDFSTIVSAIFEGRRIAENIRKVVVYLLSSVLDELFLIGGAITVGIPLPLGALQILFVNFFSDSLPAIAFAFDDGSESHRQSSPRLFRSFLDRETRFLIFVIGVVTSAVLFLTYALILSLGFDQSLVHTFVFAAFGTYTLFLAFALRDLRKSIFQYNPLGNWRLTLGAALGLGFMAAAVYFPPLQGILHTVSLPLWWVLGVVAVGIFNVVLIEFSKRLFQDA